jgi:hypothetical protein
MSEDINKAQAFLTRLMSNPGMKGMNALQVEEQLLQFLQINGSKLYPTLSSPAFFNGMPPNQVFQLLINTLKVMTNKQLSPQITDWISGGISLNFLRHFEYLKNVDSFKTALNELMNRILKHDLSRRNLAGPFTAIQSGLIDKYMLRSLEEQRYIGFEFRKIQRLKMTEEELVAFVKLTCLLRPAVMLFIADKEGVVQSFQNSGVITSVYGEKVMANLKNLAPTAPEEMIEAGF